MRTSLALDPAEVRMRSAKTLRASVLQDPLDNDMFTPYHDALPYWPTKSRYNLELTIPTAYLTSHGLLKGSAKLSESPQHGHLKPEQSKEPSKHYQAFRVAREHGLHPTSASSPLEATPQSLRRTKTPTHVGMSTSSAHMRNESTLTNYRSFQDLSDLKQRKLSHRVKSQQYPSTRSQEDPPSSSTPGYPRKSKSYPPPPPPSRPSSTQPRDYTQSPSQGKQPTGDTSRNRKRRLSSNDRLQIRMNPRAGNLFDDLPDLFPARSMSALLRPQYLPSDSDRGSICQDNSENVSSDNVTETSSHSSSRLAGRGGGISGRQSRLQKRPRESTRRRNVTTKQETKASTQDRRRMGHSKKSKMDPVHAQHFNFKARCQLALTPEIMAACMLENISVEVWKLNHKRQTMIELGTAKLPLHRVLRRIMQRTVGSPSLYTDKDFAFGWNGFETGSCGTPVQEGNDRDGIESRFDRSSSYKDGWRLEPSLYDIRSRHGTIVGQLDADIWIHPRSRSDSMVSAAA